MLGDGEAAVEDAAGGGEEALLGEGAEVHEPDAGHLMHGDESPLEGVVERLVGRVRDGEGADEVEALPEIGVPEFVGPWEGLEGALVDHGSLLEGGIGAGHGVAPP